MSGPPRTPLGDQMSVTLSVSLNGSRHRDTDEARDIITRWACRWAKRRFTEYGYQLDGSSAEVYPGRTYLGWWFGSVEVFLRR